ncbi:MAG: hypothetical protein Q6363_000185 [Candidatus Njordarchaeota archaeon]
MREDEFIIKGGAEVEVVSRVTVCECKDKRGRLLYDFKKNEFVHEGKCKLFLLCTIIEMQQFKSELSKNNFGSF